jgi:hypothetical protein
MTTTTTTTTKSSVDGDEYAKLYTTIGNATNIVVLTASLIYAAIVLVDSPMLDSTWKKDGFCIQNRNVDYWSSFDTCLYVDVIFSAILGLLWLSWKNKPGMKRASELVPMVIMSTVGHGIAHGQMALKFRQHDELQEEGGDGENDLSTAPFWQVVAFVCCFWFPLLKASLHKVPSWIVMLVAVTVTCIHGSMPKEFSFGYVQTVVSMAFHTSQLMLPSSEKSHREYATLPLSGALPLITAWNEALFCNAYFKAAGGHMLYDASIILSFLVFYMDAYHSNVLSSTTTKSTIDGTDISLKKKKTS